MASSVTASPSSTPVTSPLHITATRFGRLTVEDLYRTARQEDGALCDLERVAEGLPAGG
jgi:hypothetical protein